jgi:hypothetical protein
MGNGALIFVCMKCMDMLCQNQVQAYKYIILFLSRRLNPYLLQQKPAAVSTPA